MDRIGESLAAVAEEFDWSRYAPPAALPHRPERSAGIIRFDATPDGGCRITIRLSYNPPAGALGHIVASLFGSDPKRAMNADLVCLKSLLEHGKTTVHGEAIFED